MSVGVHFRAGEQTPRAVYTFENGRIRTIVSPRYERHGNGYIRSRARVTFFSDDGVPYAQVNQSGVAVASTDNPFGQPAVQRAALAVKDAVQILLPRMLHAEENDGACWSEWLSYTAASGVLAVAATALTAAAPACISTGVGCAAAGPAFLAFVVALDKWNLALEKLADCIDAQRRLNPATSGGSGGGDSYAESGGDWEDGGGGSASDGWSEEARRFEDAVNSFIDDSIESGDFWCSSDGDYCIYYLE